MQIFPKRLVCVRISLLKTIFKNIFMLKKITVPTIIFLVICSNLFFGFKRLGTYTAVDEPYWTYERTPDFWRAVAAHKWKNTDINDKPGVTVAILSGFGLLKDDPLAYKKLRGEIKTLDQLAAMDEINFYFRLPIFLFCTFSLLLYYFFLRKLLGQVVAILGFMLIGLSPIIFGMSLIINPDSLLWIFLPLSILGYLIYQKENRAIYLYVSAALLGLSLLTKYVANILYIFFFLLPFLEYVFQKDKTSLKPYLKKSALDYLKIVVISMLTFYVLFPATWKDPSKLLEGTFLSKAFETTWPLFAATIGIIALDVLALNNKLTKHLLDLVSKYKNVLFKGVVAVFLLLIAIVFINTYSGMKFLDFEGIISSPKGIGSGNILEKYSGAVSADTYSLIFGLHPLALLALIFALAKGLRKKGGFSENDKVVFYFSLFIIFYYFASSVNEVVATVRYQITLYPLALIISAIGISLLISQKYISKFAPKTLTYAFLLFFLLVSMLYVKPFYLAYSSFLLPEKYILNVKDMGDGSYEAAQYLNSLPNPQELLVWSDKGAVCAEFLGKCVTGFTKKDLSGRNFDYFVISAGREGRSLKLSGSVNDMVDFKKIYSTDSIEKSIFVGGRKNNFVRIISANALK